LKALTAAPLASLMHAGARRGDIARPIFARSAVKLQVLPLIESGAADRSSLTDTEIALACASHGGEPGSCPSGCALA
jgi:L-asparaginase II